MSTGISIDQNVSNIILEAYTVAKRLVDTFITKRLPEGSSLSFLDPIKKVKLRTFSNLKKKKSDNDRSKRKKEIQITANEYKFILKSSNHCQFIEKFNTFDTPCHIFHYLSQNLMAL